MLSPPQSSTVAVFTSAKRPRPRWIRYAAIGLSLCAVSYMVLWDDDDIGLLRLHPPSRLWRRRLAYLDDRPAKPLPYGRSMVDQNFQSLVRPSDIEYDTKSDILRKQSHGLVLRERGGYDASSACDNVLLFLPHSFAHNGHGSQLNNYILAAMIATFTNRAMVVLEPPPALNLFKSNSQFGCPPEAWKTKKFRSDAPPKKVGWNFDIPMGIGRLIKHPAWLSRQCPVPCEEFDYDRWEEMRLENNATEVPIPQEIRCQSKNKDGEGRSASVILMGGQQVRDYFRSHYMPRMLDRSQQGSLPAADWALRLGARPHEARVFSKLTDRHQIWDYASALLSRSGILRFQPWIARDVEEYIRNIPDLQLDVPYDGMHVRRGDKLASDARFQVRKYWQDMGQYDEETGRMPTNYIPFAHYLSQFDVAQDGDDVECQEKEGARLVYVATDDPAEVHKEVANLPKDPEGNAVLVTKKGCRMKFRFVFGHQEASAEGSFHLNGDASKGDCEERYARNIAGIADLLLLAKADIFVGEFNSNWGRLVRTFRLRVNDSAKVENGARPVLTRGEMRVAWGQRRPGPPGW